MPIVFAAIVPHPPVLIPQIGKENVKKLAVTRKAYEKLADDLKASQAETVLVISPHGKTNEDAFIMNLNPVYKANLESFGDFTNKQTWPGNIGLTHRIREQLETKAPLILTSEESLDYGSAIPMILMTKNAPSLKIIPLYYSGLSLAAHFEFGELLNKELQKSNENIAVIASGDLSHRVTKDAPAGFSPRGKKFDKKLSDLLLKNKNQDILGLDPELISEAGECGLKSILILLGILNGIKLEPQLYSYEAPFGVGYLVINYKF